MKNRMLRGLCAFLAVIGALTSSQAVYADPHSAPVQIVQVRVYSTGGPNTDVAYIVTSSAGVCATTGFGFLLNSPSGQGMLSTALSALSSGNKVVVEVSNTTGCTQQYNFGPAVQSLTLVVPGNPGW